MILRPKVRTVLSCLGLVACIFAIYGQVASHDFVAYDSGIYITNNPRVLAGLSWNNVVWAFTSTWAANWHPLTWLSHMLDIQMFGLKPAGHQLENVAWHAANSVILFLLLQRATRQWGKSLFVAALFALHPMHVESVAWVVERKDILCAFFGLACLWFYVLYAERPSAWKFLAALACLALGLLSKPMIVTWPFVLLLFDVWPLQRTELGVRRLVLEKLPFFALTIAFSIATVIAQRSGGAVQSLGDYPFHLRVANALGGYATYVGKLLWPTNMALHYPLRAHGPPEYVVGLGLALLVVVTILVLRGMRQRKYLVGWFYFVGTLVPVIGLVQVGSQAYADRFTYLPSIGFFVIVAWAGEELCARIALGRASDRSNSIDPKRPGPKRIDSRRLGTTNTGTTNTGTTNTGTTSTGTTSTGPKDTSTRNIDPKSAPRGSDGEPGNWLALSAATAICASLAVVSWRQIGTWRNTLTVSQHAIAVTEDNNVARNLLGMALVDQNELEAACDQFREALRIAPGDLDSLDNYAAALTRMNRLDEAEVQFRKALSLAPTRANLHHHLGMTLQSKGKYDEALVYLNEAVRLHPEYFAAHTSRGQVLESLGRNDEARIAYERAVAVRPSYIPAWMSLARMLMRLNDYDGAAAALTRAVAVDPSNAEIHRGLARAYMARSRAREAQSELDLVLRLRPDWPVAEADLAWLLATTNDDSVRNVKRAIELGENAMRASADRQPTILDALAAAYAADERFVDARAVAEKAVARAKEMGDPDLAARIEKRLAAYRANRMDRETPR